MRDITLEETVYFNFTTRSFSTGVPTSLLGSPVLSVLESNNATPITAGVSVQVDRASVTGLNQATIVATAANGYEAGKSYGLYISTGTVGGVSVVGEVVAEFTVQSSAAFTRLGAPAGASVSADIATKMATYTQPTGFLAATFPATVASTTNITAGTITTTTNLTNLPAITPNWLTSAGITGGALNGKGDWNIGKTGYSLTQTFPTNFASIAITAGGIVDADVEAVTGDTGAATKFKRVLLGNTTATVGTGSSTTSIVTSSMNPAANVTDQFKGKIISFDDATTTTALRGQSTDITASTAAGVLTVTALTTAPVSGDTFTVS
jgi:hypothetical protein